MLHVLEATALIWGNDLTTMLSSTLGLAPPLPAPTPSVFIILNSLTGCGSSGSFLLQESGSSETLEDFSAPLFCGNQDSSETRRVSSTAFCCGRSVSASHPQDSRKSLNDSSAPLFCGNQDSSETRRDSSAALFAGETLQRRTPKIPENH